MQEEARQRPTTMIRRRDKKQVVTTIDVDDYVALCCHK